MSNLNKITIRSNDGFCEVLQDGKVLKGLAKVEILPITRDNQNNIQARLTFTDVELELPDVAANDEYPIAPYILTATGKHFNLLKPTPDTVCIHDIAFALSQQCRFNGHCVDVDGVPVRFVDEDGESHLYTPSVFYSVAQHSVLVSYLVPQHMALKALLHDGEEAYLGDMTSPLKQFFPLFKELSRKASAVIFERFGLEPGLPAEVKRADLAILATEKRDLMPYDHRPWDILVGVEPVQATIVPLMPDAALTLFLDRFYELTKQAAA